MNLTNTALTPTVIFIPYYLATTKKPYNLCIQTRHSHLTNSRFLESLLKLPNIESTADLFSLQACFDDRQCLPPRNPIWLTQHALNMTLGMQNGMQIFSTCRDHHEENHNPRRRLRYTPQNISYIPVASVDGTRIRSTCDCNVRLLTTGTSTLPSQP